MNSDFNIFNHIYVKRFFAASIDFGVEFGSALLGGYFGAMMAALVIVLGDVSPAATQKAIWTGMCFGFFFWGLAVSCLNRVLIQGYSRATIGKKYMNLEVVTTGSPISWEVMFKHWVTASFSGELRVVSSLDFTSVAPVISIHSKPAVTTAVPSIVATVEESSDKKAA